MSIDQPIRMVCFDWGGVIVRICRSFREGCDAAGLVWRDGASDPDLYLIRRSIASEFQVGRMSDEAFFTAVSEGMGGLYSPAEIALVHDAWLLDEYPGAGALIDELNSLDGLATGMLSNTNERHWARRLVDFPAAGRLAHQHASHLLGVAKPEPGVFKAFESATGFGPGEILFFDDLEENITAARAAGWHAVLVDHTGDPAAQIRAALVELRVL